MKMLRSLPLVASAALVGCAGQTYRVDVGAMFAKASGDIALQNGGTPHVLHDNQNDLDRNLGVGDTEPSPYLRVEMDQERHRVRLHGFGVESDGSGTLAGAYGNLAAGSQVTTSLEFFGLGVTYAWELYRDDHFRIGGGAALNWYSLDVAARSSLGREAVRTDAVVPMPYGEVEAFLGPVTLGANLGIMSADLGDASTRYLDFETYLRWQAIENFDLMLGYRYVVLDGYGRATSRDFDADIDVQGIFVTAGIKF